MNFNSKNIFLSILISTRPKQWTKNLLIYLPLLFSVNESWQFSEFSSLQLLFIKTTIAYIAFCLVTVAVYIINDLLDMNILIHKLVLFFNFLILGILFLFCPEGMNKLFIFLCLIIVLLSLIFFYRIKRKEKELKKQNKNNQDQ